MFNRFLLMLRSEQALSPEIRLQLVNSLFYPFASFITGALAGVWIAATISYLVDDVVVQTTADIIVVVAIGRIIVGLWYIRGEKVNEGTVSFWEIAYAIGAGLFSLSLGVVTLLALLRTNSEPLHLMLTTTTAAYAASITGRNAGRPYIALSQLYIAAIPMCVGLMMHPTLFYQIVGLALLFFMFGMTDITLSVRETIVGALTTQLKNSQLAKASQEQAALFDDALNNMSHGLCMFDQEGKLLVFNQKLLALLNHDGFGIVTGMSLKELLYSAGQVVPSSRNLKLIKAVRRNLRSMRSRKTFTHLADGTVIAVSRQTMQNGNVVLVFEDVTEQARAHERIQQLAWTDELTGLMNRAAFRDLLSKQLSKVEQSAPLALHLIDLDNFKSVNDTLGHPVGDLLLVEVATSLIAVVGTRGHIARLGGDEFVVIQSMMNSDSADYRTLADQIVAKLSDPFAIAGHSINIGASLGIALAPSHGVTGDVLLKRADMALYKAKGLGRREIVVFETDLDEQVQLRHQLDLDLRTAIAEHQFSLAFQPILELSSGKITAMETLIRWRHPTRGWVSPAEFVPVAEETGLIIAVGRWVLEQACAVLSTLESDITFAINLSAVQFQDRDFCDFLSATLAKYRIPASRIELEITETALLIDTSGTNKMLDLLRAVGVGISLDDFGTGYSSLSHLRNFPFTKIKIDGSFVRDLGHNASSIAVIRAVCNVAQILNIPVVAECVESEEQLQFLAQSGCSHVQGFLLGRPQPAERLPLLLTEHSPSTMRALLAA